MMLPTGSQNEVELGSSSPEDGRNYLPKHVELIGIINKPLLLNLFLIYLLLLYNQSYYRL